MLCEHSEPFIIDAAQAAVACHAARVRALGLKGKLYADVADVEDFQQTLLLDLLKRVRHFNRSRATWPTFTSLVMRNASKRITQRHVQHHRVLRPLSQALQHPDESVPPESSIHITIDLRRAMDRLRPDLLKLAAEIIRFDTITDAQRASNMPKAVFYRALRELRLNLLAAGASLETFPHFRKIQRKRSRV